jgi:hypothetical protein
LFWINGRIDLMKDSGKSLSSQHRNAAAQSERWIPTTILIPEGEKARSDSIIILDNIRSSKEIGVTLEFHSRFR